MTAEELLRQIEFLRDLAGDSDIGDQDAATRAYARYSVAASVVRELIEHKQGSQS